MRSPKLIGSFLLSIPVLFATALVIAFAVMTGREAEDSGLSLLLLDMGMYIAYGLIAGSIVLAFIFPLISIIRQFRTSHRTLMGAGAVLLVFLIAWLFSPAFTGEFYTSHQISSGAARLINAGLITTYLALGFTIVLFVYSEVARNMK